MKNVAQTNLNHDEKFNVINEKFCHQIRILDNMAVVKKSLVLEPGTSKISIRTSNYFHPMSEGQVK